MGEMFFSSPKTPTIDPPASGTIERAEWDIQLLAAGVRAVHRDLRIIAAALGAAVAGQWLGFDPSAIIAAISP